MVFENVRFATAVLVSVAVLSLDALHTTCVSVDRVVDSSREDVAVLLTRTVDDRNFVPEEEALL